MVILEIFLDPQYSCDPDPLKDRGFTPRADSAQEVLSLRAGDGIAGFDTDGDETRA